MLSEEATCSPPGPPIDAIEYGRGQLAACQSVEGPFADCVLRVRDRSGRSAAIAESVANELAEVEPARPDAEEDEAAAEDEDQEDERPLRLVAQAREEHRLFGYARGTAASGLTAGGAASMARLALCAAAVSSCQSVPPFS